MDQLIDQSKKNNITSITDYPPSTITSHRFWNERISRGACNAQQILRTKCLDCELTSLWFREPGAVKKFDQGCFCVRCVLCVCVVMPSLLV